MYDDVTFVLLPMCEEVPWANTGGIRRCTTIGYSISNKKSQTHVSTHLHQYNDLISLYVIKYIDCSLLDYYFHPTSVSEKNRCLKKVVAANKMNSMFGNI